MPPLGPTVNDFVDNFEFYRKNNIISGGWYEVKEGKTATGWQEVKESKKPWFQRISSRKRSIETASAALMGLKYSSTPFYRIRRKCGTRVTKMLPTITIPNLPKEMWQPTKGHSNVPKEITIVIFEADGYMLGQDPGWPLRKERVSRIPSPKTRLETTSVAPREGIGQRQRWNRWLRSRPSWTSGSTVLTWTESEGSSKEQDAVGTASQPDVEQPGWIASAVFLHEETQEAPSVEA